jgi:hypothetical protein
MMFLIPVAITAITLPARIHSVGTCRLATGFRTGRKIHGSSAGTDPTQQNNAATLAMDILTKMGFSPGR